MKVLARGEGIEREKEGKGIRFCLLKAASHNAFSSSKQVRKMLFTFTMSMFSLLVVRRAMFMGFIVKL